MKFQISNFSNTFEKKDLKCDIGTKDKTQKVTIIKALHSIRTFGGCFFKM